MHDGRVYCVDDVARPAGDDVLRAVADDQRCGDSDAAVCQVLRRLCRHWWTVGLTASL